MSALTLLTPAEREAQVLEEMWEVLKKHEMTHDAGIRSAIRLIVSCAVQSGDTLTAYAYAQRLLTRSAVRLGGDGLKPELRTGEGRP